MRRISTDADYLRDGTVTLDADGIPLEWSTKADTDYVDAADQALGQRMTGQSLAAGTDLNTVTTPGAHYSDSRPITNSLLSLPGGISPEAFELDVAIISALNGIRRQTITQKVSGQPTTRKWERISLANSWMAWGQTWPVDLSGKADVNHTHDASKIGNLDKFVDARIPEERRWDLTTTSITWWGDSQVETGSGGAVWPTAEQMPQQTGQYLTTPTISNGRSGATSNYVLAKAGVIKLYVAPVTIPASGYVNVTVTGVPITPTTNTNLDGMILAGVRGTLRYYPDRWIFLRDTAGTAVTLTEPTLVETSTPVDPTAAHVVVMGGNDWTTSDFAPESDRTTHTIAAYQRMMEAVPGLGADKKIIIGGIKTRRDTAAGDENDRYVREVNDRLAELYPAHFVPYQHWLATRALTAAGITPTAGDLTQMAAGLAPASAFEDQTHLKKSVVAAMAREVWAPEIVRRGWAAATGELPEIDWWPTPADPITDRVDHLDRADTIEGNGWWAHRRGTTVSLHISGAPNSDIIMPPGWRPGFMLWEPLAAGKANMNGRLQVSPTGLVRFLDATSTVYGNATYLATQ